MLRTMGRKIKYGLMIELELMIGLRSGLKWRLGLALGILFAASMALSYLVYRPYLYPEHRWLVVLGLVIMNILIMSPFACLGLAKRYKGKFFIGLFLLGWGLAYAAFYFQKKSGILLLANEMEPLVEKTFALSLLSLFLGVWLLETLLHKISEEKAVIEAEVLVAHEIQTMLLPTVARTTGQYSLFGRSTQAREVGGDYFDIVDLPDGRLAVAIGDVSGHNVAAGLLMAMTKAAFRTELHYLKTPIDLAKSLNQTLFENSDRKMFVSFMCGFLDFEHRCLELLNAGHLPLLHFQAATGKVVHHQPKGMALAMTPAAFFGVARIPFAPGDRFLFLTDGLEEACDRNGRLFGMDRIRRLFRDYPDAQDFHYVMNRELLAFCGTEALDDDVTTVLINCAA